MRQSAEAPRGTRTVPFASSSCAPRAALTCRPPITRYAELIAAKRMEAAEEAGGKEARASEEEAGADAAFKKEL